MQAIVNFTQNNAEHGGSPDELNHRTARLFKLFGLRTATLLPTILICLMMMTGHGTSVAQTVSRPTNAAAPSDAQKALEQMKTLTGSWQGTIMGIPLDVTIRPASSRTALLHEAHGDGKRPPDHEITMFYVEGERLLATHYCDGGNRARLEGKISPDGKTIEFTLLDVAGSTQGGLVKRMMFTMIDANKHAIELTFVMPNGKPVELRAEFQRTK
ncbi:MAG TPA: hypothetical protein VGV59_07765 [Pyrinomonadaceae bacterium]|nr:hypothetical protein [Pyrinomonadaceae bacterium]